MFAARSTHMYNCFKLSLRRFDVSNVSYLSMFIIVSLPVFTYLNKYYLILFTFIILNEPLLLVYMISCLVSLSLCLSYQTDLLLASLARLSKLRRFRLHSQNLAEKTRYSN